MENKIRINSSTKKINVNDEGEFILLPLADDSFVLGFYKLMDYVQDSARRIPGLTEDAAGNVDAVEQIVELEKETRAKVEALFGEGTCRKVFGDILPSMDLFVEFFGSVVPFLEEYKQERVKRMGKYDAGRTGTAL